jgi:hypothetical protein
VVGVGRLSGDTSVCVGSVWQCCVLGYEGVMMKIRLTRRGEIVRDILQGLAVAGFIVGVLFIGGWIDGL